MFKDEHSLLSSLFEKQGELQKNSVAQKYGGHQFGQWNPYLGDGRGLLLGEAIDKKGHLVDLHLKGSGPTPYSRHADGRAVLRSTIREYLASEAMHGLGIPTSRSLAMIASKEPVWREQLESAAMMIRTCPSHIRFGHFEYFYHNNEPDKLSQLFDFCFRHHFAHLSDTENPYLELLTQISKNTAKLIAAWQAYGFNHGVMNTDNMSIHGISFDYGPYAFLDDFNPQYICNKSDHSGRYAFNQQPSIGLWNLNALAHAFSQQLSIEELKSALSSYEPTFLKHYDHLLAQRLGFSTLDRHAKHQSETILLDRHAKQVSEKQSSLSQQFVSLLANEHADFHLSFRRLSQQVINIVQGDFEQFINYFQQKDAFLEWCIDYQKCIKQQKNEAEEQQKWMLSKNPKFVVRNHHLQHAIAKAENGDFTMVESIFEVAQSPFTENMEYDYLSSPPSPDEKGTALSCSS